MAGVRLVATVWGILGWITLAISGVVLVVFLTHLGRYVTPAGVGVSAGALAPVFLLALGPFTI